MAHFTQIDDQTLICTDSILSLKFKRAYQDTDEHGTPDQPVNIQARLEITTAELVEKEIDDYKDKYLETVVVNRVHTVRGEAAEKIWSRFFDNESVTSRLADPDPELELPF